MTKLEIPNEPEYISIFKEFISNQIELPEIVTSMQSVLFEAFDNTMDKCYGGRKVSDYYAVHTFLETLTVMAISYLKEKN